MFYSVLAPKCNMHISYESQRKNNKLFCAVKGRNISVGDVVSHVSDGIFIRNLFLVSKWMEPCNLFGLLCFPWRSFYGYMHDV